MTLWQSCFCCFHGHICWKSRSRVERLPKMAAGQICPSVFPSHFLAEIAFSRGASAQNGSAADMPVYVGWYLFGGNCIFAWSVCTKWAVRQICPSRALAYYGWKLRSPVERLLKVGSAADLAV